MDIWEPIWNRNLEFGITGIFLVDCVYAFEAHVRFDGLILLVINHGKEIGLLGRPPALFAVTFKYLLLNVSWNVNEVRISRSCVCYYNCRRNPPLC